MANTSIERMLEINSRLGNGDASQRKVSDRKVNVRSKEELDSLIENIDRQVYGPTPVQPNEGISEKYDPKKEMKKLKEIQEHGGRGAVDLEGKSIPREIAESIINNPLDIFPIDPKMDELEERLQGNMPGIKAAANILERVEKNEQEARAKINEELYVPKNGESNVDYDEIRRIVESVIDEKMATVTQSLNESTARQGQYVPSMKVLNFKDKFYFVDNDDNVFVCEMKYKGKRKKK